MAHTPMERRRSRVGNWNHDCRNETELIFTCLRWLAPKAFHTFNLDLGQRTQRSFHLPTQCAVRTPPCQTVMLPNSSRRLEKWSHASTLHYGTRQAAALFARRRWWWRFQRCTGLLNLLLVLFVLDGGGLRHFGREHARSRRGGRLETGMLLPYSSIFTCQAIGLNRNSLHVATHTHTHACWTFHTSRFCGLTSQMTQMTAVPIG
jgi:hypothetical protein